MPRSRRLPKQRRATMDPRVRHYLLTGEGNYVRFFVRREVLAAAWREFSEEAWGLYRSGELRRPPFGRRLELHDPAVHQEDRP